MPGKLSSLYTELILNAESFNNGLKAAQREAKEFEKNLKPTLTATKDLGVGMAAAGTAIAGGLLAASKAAIDYGDKLNDARQKTGLTAQELANLGFAAEQSGSSFEGISTGLKFLAKNMESAIAKGGDTRAAFNELGISSKDLAAKQGDVNSVFLLVADRLKGIDDPAKKAALSMAIFGKAGVDLIPLLNEGSAGIAELGKNAAKVSDDFVKASDQLNDTLNEVSQAALGASIGIAEALLPSLQSIATTVADAAREFSAFAKAHPQLIEATAALGVALVTVGTGLTAVAVIVPKLVAGFELAKAAVAGLGGAMSVLSGIAIVALIEQLAELYNAYRKNEEAQANLQKQLGDLSSAEQKAVEELKKHGIQVRLEQVPVERRTELLAQLGKEMQAQSLATNKATAANKDHIKTVVDEAAAEKAHKKALEDAKEAQELMTKGMRIALDMRIQDAQLLPRLTKLQFEFNDSLRAGGEAAIQAAADLGEFNTIVEQAVAGMQQAQYNAEQMQKDFDSISKTNPGVQIGVGFEQSAASIKKNIDEAKRLEDATKDIKNSAGHIFDDMFLKGESVFSSLGNALKGGALSLGRAIFEDIAGALLGPVKAAFDAFFEGLLQSTGITKLISGLAKSLGDAITGIFGGGASGAASAVAGAGTTAATTAAAGGTSAAGGAASGLVAGLAGGIVSALGSFVSSLRLEGTLNAVEFNTRATRIEIADMMDLILQPMLARLEDIKAELFNHKFLPDLVEILGNQTIEAVNNVAAQVAGAAAAIVGAIGSIRITMPEPQVAKAITSSFGSPAMATPAGGGIAAIFGGSIPALQHGTDFVPRTGLYQLHKGEQVKPAGQAGGMTINVYVEGSVIRESDLVQSIGNGIKKLIRQGSFDWPATHNLQRQAL